MCPLADNFLILLMLFFFSRGLAPQNKPELQKVMEKRKRDQVIKQKEEEAQKKKSDLEIELLKRQQKLEQVKVVFTTVVKVVFFLIEPYLTYNIV